MYLKYNQFAFTEFVLAYRKLTDSELTIKQHFMLQEKVALLQSEMNISDELKKKVKAKFDANQINEEEAISQMKDIGEIESKVEPFLDKNLFCDVKLLGAELSALKSIIIDAPSV